MRISDWSSDVCSSDLCPSRTGWRWEQAGRKPAGSCGLLQALHVVQVVLAQLAGEDARMAVADRLAVELGHRQHEGGAGGEKGFPRRPGLRHRKGALLEPVARLADQLAQREAGDAVERSEGRRVG